MIKQIIPDKEVQVGLTIEVDGIVVNYNPHIGEFAYTFYVHIGENKGESKTINEASEICLKAISVMENQSYDDMKWKRINLNEDLSMIDKCNVYMMTVNFEIR